MLDFFHLGETLLSSLQSFGDFLFDTIINVEDVVGGALGKTIVSALFPNFDISSYFGEYSLVYFVLGGGLVFILAFRLLKFFTDLIF